MTTPAGTVRAATLLAPRRLEVREYPYPTSLEPGAVLLRMLASGICGTDKHTYRGETEQYLVPAPNLACGRCHMCARGFPYYLCPNIENYGNSTTAGVPPHLFGGWSEYLYLKPGTAVFRVPDEPPDDVAVLSEIFAVTHSLERAAAMRRPAGLRPGDAVAIIGAGPLGLAHAIKASLMGAGQVLVLDPSSKRRALAARVADAVAIAPGDGATAEVRERSHGEGVDVVVNATAFPGAFAQAPAILRDGGTIIEVGAFVDMGDEAFNPAVLCGRSLTPLGVGGEDAHDPVELVQFGGEVGDRALSANLEVDRDVASMAVAGAVLIVLDLEVRDREPTLRALRERLSQKPAAVEVDEAQLGRREARARQHSHQEGITERDDHVDHGGRDRHQRQVAAAGHPDSGRDPHARCRRETADRVAPDEDDAAADEADPRNDLRRDARRVERRVRVPEHVAEAVGADQHEHGRADAHERVGAQAGRLLPDLALEADTRRQHEGEPQPPQDVQLVHNSFITRSRPTYAVP
jgi:threonine dehydrogenase-like Zn-dependent dehydrogenase